MAGITSASIGTVTTSGGGTQDVNLLQVGSASFALGQQLAASSLPVVLTAAQITTLTPLSTVTANQGTAGSAEWLIGGGVASGASDSGNPVKVGGKYNATQPTFTDGDRGDLQIGLRGSLKVELWGSDSNVAVTRYADNADDVAASATSRNLAVQNRNTVFDGTTWDRMRGDSTDGVLVNLGANNNVTQSGTWTVQPGNTANTTPWLASIHDGTTKATVRDLASNDALNVAIVDGSGGQITTFGGGTQYTEADTDTTITGTAFMWEDASDTLRAVSASKPLPVDTELPAAALLADDMSNPTVPQVGAHLMGYDGSTWDRVKLGTLFDLDTGGGTENVVGINLRTGASGGSVEAGTTTNPLIVAGNVAEDTADAGNPVKIGGKAMITNPTAVSDADRVNARFDDIGRLVTVTGQVRDLIVQAITTIASSTSETTILAAGAAGVFHDITDLIITNASATAVTVTIKDSTTGTTRAIFDLGAIGSNSAIPLNFSRPWLQATAANNWTATLSSGVVTVNFLVIAEKNV